MSEGVSQVAAIVFAVTVIWLAVMWVAVLPTIGLLWSVGWLK
jgi:hypothetical protein